MFGFIGAELIGGGRLIEGSIKFRGGGGGRIKLAGGAGGGGGILL